MRTTLITGASSGIGRALAIACRRRGDRVVAIARRAAALRAVAREVGEDAPVWHVEDIDLEATSQRPPTGVWPITCDTSEPDAVRRVAHALGTHGFAPDLLLLAAGCGDAEDEHRLEVERHRTTFATNYFGALHWVEAFYEPGAARTFVAVSSVAGFRGLPGAPAYGASKAALTHAFEALACSAAGTGHRFVLVHPGPVDTPMLKVDRPVPFTITAQDAAERILRGLDHDRPQIDFAGPWPLLARILRSFPVRWHRHLFGVRRAQRRTRRASAP